MKIHLFLLLLVGNSFSQEDPYLQFLNFIDNGNYTFEIQYFQEQFGSQYEDKGALYFISSSYYIFDGHSQRIIFQDGEITTINKNNKQIILDSMIPGETTIFDILSGSRNSLKINQVILEKNGFKINFRLTDLEISGAIWTIPQVGQPKEILLELGPESYIKIRIISIKPLDINQLEKIDFNQFETIDLRE